LLLPLPPCVRTAAGRSKSRRCHHRPDTGPPSQTAAVPSSCTRAAAGAGSEGEILRRQSRAPSADQRSPLMAGGAALDDPRNGMEGSGCGDGKGGASVRTPDRDACIAHRVYLSLETGAGGLRTGLSGHYCPRARAPTFFFFLINPSAHLGRPECAATVFLHHWIWI